MFAPQQKDQWKTIGGNAFDNALSKKYKGT